MPPRALSEGKSDLSIMISTRADDDDDDDDDDDGAHERASEVRPILVRTDYKRVPQSGSHIVDTRHHAAILASTRAYCQNHGDFRNRHHAPGFHCRGSDRQEDVLSTRTELDSIHHGSLLPSYHTTHLIPELNKYHRTQRGPMAACVDCIIRILLATVTATTHPLL